MADGKKTGYSACMETRSFYVILRKDMKGGLYKAEGMADNGTTSPTHLTVACHESAHGTRFATNSLQSQPITCTYMLAQLYPPICT